MSHPKNLTHAGLMLFLLCMLQLQGGCAVISLLRGKPGLDISEIKPGISMIEAETILGAPKREWATIRDIRYRAYDNDGGVEGSVADAVAFGIMDVFTVGIWEIMYAIHPLPTARVRLIDGKIALSYDRSDVVIGVFNNFGDFDRLPDDGREKK
jgi:hypothetical protein